MKIKVSKKEIDTIVMAMYHYELLVMARYGTQKKLLKEIVKLNKKLLKQFKESELAG